MSVHSNSNSMSLKSEAVKRPSLSVTKSDVRKGLVSSIFEAKKMDAIEASWKDTLPQDLLDKYLSR